MPFQSDADDRLFYHDDTGVALPVHAGILFNYLQKELVVHFN